MLGYRMAPPLPAAVRNVQASASGLRLVLTWDAVPDPAGAAVIFYEVSVDNGRTWTATGSRDARWESAELLAGTYLPRVRARNAAGAGPASGEIPAVTLRRQRVSASLDLFVGQWRSSPRLRGVVSGALDILREEIEKPLAVLERMRRLATAEGVWLDYIGARLGLPRPSTTQGATDPRFGFDSAGVGFDQAPFAGADVNAARAPLGDTAYRGLLQARARTVLADGTETAFRQAVEEIDPTATVLDRRDMTARVVTETPWLLQLADDLGALPRPAGVEVEYGGRDRFGFDRAGQPFDQGHWT